MNIVVYLIKILMEKQIILNNQGAECYYIKGAISTENNYLNRILNETPFHNDVVKMYDKTYVTEREVAYYSDASNVYDYSGFYYNGLNWTNTISEIKNKVESITGYTYNFCVINKYPSGNSTIGWHYDKLGAHIKGYPIASVSFGATRDFQIRARKEYHHILGKKILHTLPLNDGDILVMSGNMQDMYMHSVPKRANVNGVRINLTFRRLQ